MKNLYLAGVGNSLGDHWQRQWYETDSDGVWLEHSEWMRISRDTWLLELHEVVQRERDPLLLIAHSLGCLLAGEYVSKYGAQTIRGALLVAVPDPLSPAFPQEVSGFCRGDSLKISLDCTVVASSDDPYGSVSYGRAVASQWGGDFVEIGPRGHINAASGLGTWNEGRSLLARWTGGPRTMGNGSE